MKLHWSELLIKSDYEIEHSKMDDNSISDDSNDVITNRKFSSSKKRQLDSSSNSDEETYRTPRKPQNGESASKQKSHSRSSERIKDKRSKSFRMPTKEELWSAIPSTDSPEKTYSELKPRKLVNNFTKVTNRYNHDPAYTSEEGESMDGFLVMGDQSTTSDTSDSDYYEEAMAEIHSLENRKRRKHRIKKRRIVQCSSDSDSTSKDTYKTENDVENVKGRLRKKLLNRLDSVDEANKGNSTYQQDNETIMCPGEPVVDCSSDEEIKPVPNSTKRNFTRKRRRKQRRKITDEHSNDENESDDCSRNSSVEHVLSSESSDIGKSKMSDTEDTVLVSGRRKRSLSILESSDSSQDCSGSSSEDGTRLSRGQFQLKQRREKTTNLFKDFKNARSKLEAKKSSK